MTGVKNDIRSPRTCHSSLLKNVCCVFVKNIHEKGKKSMAIATMVLGAAFSVTGFLVWLVIGLIAGFIASRLMGAGGYGLVGDIVVGLVGAFIGGLIANLLIPDANFGLIGSIIVAIIGACLLIWIFRTVTRGRTL
jgi:uncharacterized membrane protein YeaQ/YmgE (transglycosylase-associated protein family)